MNAPTCPKCGEPDARAIVYGLPAEPPSEDEELGGCIISDDAPAFRCTKCGEGFGRLEETKE